jgi:hypothetical protein
MKRLVRLIRKLIPVLGFSSLSLFAAEINRIESNGNIVWVGNLLTANLQMNDSVCFYQGNGILGCGIVTGFANNSVAVKLTEKKRVMNQGDQVSIRKNIRTPATTETVSEKFNDSEKRYTGDAAIGMSAGHNYFYPMAHFQLAVTRQFSLGIMPVFASYSQNDSSVNFYGAFATATYYHSHYAFKGFNFEAGLGYFHLGAKATNIAEETVNPVSLKLTAGWRGRALWGMPLDLGAAVGGQYVFLDTTPLDVSYKKLLPMLTVFIAYAF